MSMDNQKRWTTVTLMFSFMIPLLVGCVTHRKNVSKPENLDVPKDFSDTGTASVPDRWWRTLGDTRLNRFIQTALNENFELRSAWSRLRRAEAVVQRASSPLYPQVDGVGTAEVSRTDAVDDQFEDFEQESLRLGLNAEYEIDLWGRIESDVEAEQFRARATFHDYQSTALSLSAEIARTWYRLIEQKRQIEVLNDQIETNERVYELIKIRFGRGQVRSADLLRQEQLLESTREQKITVQSRVQTLEHQLSVLLGQSPVQSPDYSFDRLPELPPRPKTGVPVQLIRRRPDVRSAFDQLKAADREVASAIAEQYPRLNLTASLSSTQDDERDLFRDWARSFAADLTAPLIDANQREAEVDRTQALKRQRLNEYGDAVLTAFREVEDALIQEKKQAERIKRLERQLELANQTVQRLRVEYLNGNSPYIDVLESLTEQQQLRRDLLEARLIRVEDRVNLYRALAGGFDTGRNPKQISDRKSEY